MGPIRSVSCRRLTLAPCSVEHLRDLRAFFGTTFKIKAIEAAVFSEEGDEDDAPKAPAPEEYVLSCVGTGFTNTAKRT